MKTSSHLTVTYIDHMGSDARVAEAAWVSSDRAANRTPDDISRLIRYLARNNHWTPFGQCTITLRFHIPIFIARQLLRSNVGIVWNEESRRYVSSEPIFYIPTFRNKSPSLKQGSAGPLSEAQNTMVRLDYENTLRQCLLSYNMMILQGVAPEQARTILPVTMYTTIMGTFTLAALARVYQLRSHPHAQHEIQQLAQQIDELMISKPLEPAFYHSWGALSTNTEATPT